MTGTLPTTSFGRRTPSLAQLAAETRTKLEAGRASEPVHKWRLYRTLTEAKAAFGLPDGTLTVLHALLAFHAETALTLDSEDPSIVVFPSNRELSIRANGVPESNSSPSSRAACCSWPHCAAGLAEREEICAPRRRRREDGLRF